jgi:putative peptide zinc metalloprotease protein
MTQGEVITLLGYLYNANLLFLDLPADTEQLLRRRQERRLKKLGNTLSSFLFLRIPLWTPDALFTRWQRWGGFFFSKYGFALWCLLGMAALRQIVIQWPMFVAEARQMLVPSNLFWIYAVIVLSKIVHECGHAFACKYCSAKEGLSGDVHSMGVMFLIFAPVPYIDVSSSVLLRSRWARAAVGLAGVYSELFLAFLATLLWAATTPASGIHLLARDCVIITSVSTLLFNLNPLLRFDGYFVFSDLLNLPNLYQRSQAYTLYLLKRFVLGARRASSVVRRQGEKLLYPLYALAALAYRVLITVGIFVLLEDHFAAVGVLLSLALALFWFGLPSCKGLIYLYSSPELAGQRSSAWLRASLLCLALCFFLFALPFESAVVVEGVAESRDQRRIFAETEGGLVDFAPTDVPVQKGKSVVAVMRNRGLEADVRKMELALKVSTAKLELARDQGDANAEGRYAHEAQGDASRLEILRAEAARQYITAPVDGIWVAPELGRKRGKWIDRGNLLGVIYSPADVRLRVAVDQYDAARLFSEPLVRVEFCVSGRMGLRGEDGELFKAEPESAPVPAGRRELFHPSLAAQAGGDSPAVQGRDGELLATAHFFELRLLPEKASLPYLRSGQKVLARLVFGEQPLGLQWLRRIRQFFAGRMQ